MNRGCAWWLVAGLPAAIMVGGCTGDEVPQDPFFPGDFAEIWPEVRACRFSVEHDGAYIAVHASPEAADAYLAGEYPFVEGAVVVKREFRDEACAELEGYTAMRRLADGTLPEGGDWEWQRLDADLGVVESGLLPACVSCHQSCTMGRDLTCTDP